jgi:hypothetical protein
VVHVIVSAKMNDHSSSSEVPMFSTSNIVPDSSKPRPAPRRRQHPRRNNNTNTTSTSTSSSGRLWQLSQSSIQDYASWIQEKPKETQTPSEQRFLMKFQRRMLIRQQKLPTESMIHYIARLEAKEHISDMELQLIENYHRRKANKRAQRLLRESNPFRGSVPPAIFWRREGSRKKAPPNTAIDTTTSTASVTLLSNMANLQESMKRMGLSSEKLRDIPVLDHGGGGGGGESNTTNGSENGTPLFQFQLR